MRNPAAHIARIQRYMPHVLSIYSGQRYINVRKHYLLLNNENNYKNRVNFVSFMYMLPAKYVIQAFYRIPVSYTHLDVYKRQTNMCMCVCMKNI